MTKKLNAYLMKSYLIGFLFIIINVNTALSQSICKGDRFAQAADSLVGMLAPEWKIKQGKFANVIDLKGIVVLIEIEGVGCGACEYVKPDLNEIESMFDKSKFKIVVIKNDQRISKEEAAIDFYKNNSTGGMLYPYSNMAKVDYIDISHKYKQKAFPTFYLLDKKGIVRFAHVGYFYDDSKTKIIDLIKQIE